MMMRSSRKDMGRGFIFLRRIGIVRMGLIQLIMRRSAGKHMGRIGLYLMGYKTSLVIHACKTFVKIPMEMNSMFAPDA